MNKLVAVAQLALCCVLMFCNSSGGGSKPASLTGQWVDVNPRPDDDDEFELFSDGTAVFRKGRAAVSSTWSVVDKRFVVTSSVAGTNVAQVFDYKLSGYELTLIDNEGYASTCVRKEKLNEFKAKQAAEKAKRIAAATSTFKDSRDGKTYKKVAIGGQTWMAENLNYAANNSVCFGNDAGNCEKYGRLYDWSTAKKACPTGWHLPSDGEWTRLIDYVGGENIAGSKLKSEDKWDGTDDYGFSASLGGQGFGNDRFYGIGISGWWSATDDGSGNANHAWYRGMHQGREYVGRSVHEKTMLFSVRCVEDDKSEQAFKRGNEALDNGNYDKAIAEYTEVIRLDPEADGAYFNRGRAYFDKENYDKAIADFTKAIELDSDNAKFYNNRGFAYSNKKDYDRAIADYTKALQLDPNNEFAKKYLEEARKLKGGGELNISSPNNLKGGALTGGRSRASINRVVTENMASLRYAYNRRLREKPGLNGKIMVKFTIEEFGKVLSAQVVESTMDDPELERTVVDKVKSWDFDKIDKPGDVTEVVYPFVFSQ